MVNNKYLEYVIHGIQYTTPLQLRPRSIVYDQWWPNDVHPNLEGMMPQVWSQTGHVLENY